MNRQLLPHEHDLSEDHRLDSPKQIQLGLFHLIPNIVFTVLIPSCLIPLELNRLSSIIHIKINKARTSDFHFFNRCFRLIKVFDQVLPQSFSVLSSRLALIASPYLSNNHHVIYPLVVPISHLAIWSAVASRCFYDRCFYFLLLILLWTCSTMFIIVTSSSF